MVTLEPPSGGTKFRTVWRGWGHQQSGGREQIGGLGIVIW